MTEKGNISAAAYAYAVHDGYGCESGCCGHRIYLVDDHRNILDSAFMFAHPYGETTEEFVTELIRDRWPTAPIRFDLCEVYND